MNSNVRYFGLKWDTILVLFAVVGVMRETAEATTWTVKSLADPTDLNGLTLREAIGYAGP
jgi:hypothetical protein